MKTIEKILGLSIVCLLMIFTSLDNSEIIDTPSAATSDRSSPDCRG